jgi:hypothetical protein
VPPLRLIAAFCRLDKSLSCCWEKGWLVGAVGIENTTVRNFKDSEGMLGNAKALKRNNWECKGILIGPLMAPRFFFRPPRFRHCLFYSLSKSRSRLRAQIARRGWQADVTSSRVCQTGTPGPPGPVGASFERNFVDFVETSQDPDVRRTTSTVTASGH